MAVQLLQQQRMAYALERVQHYAEEFTAPQHATPQQLAAQKASRKKFKARSSELPFMIHANGVGQAIAFFKSKSARGDRDKYGCLYEILSGWLTQEGRPLAGHPDAITGVTQCDRNAYMLAQAEAILLMNWVKMFAASFMEVANMEVSESNTGAPGGPNEDGLGESAPDEQDGADGPEGEAA